MATQSSPPGPVLVLGAGELGTATLEALAAHPSRQLGGNISVLLRPATLHSTDPAKREQHAYLTALGIGLEPGDVVIQSIAKLASIFRRFDTVISCTGLYAPAGTQLKLTRAALEAATEEKNEGNGGRGGGALRRYFPWQYGIDYDVIGAGSAQDLFDEQLEVRALLRAQMALDWIIVSTGLFMSFLFVPGFGPVDLKGRIVRALGSWDTPVTITGPRDIGRMIAELVYDPQHVQRQPVYVAGDTVTYDQVAQLVEDRFGGRWTRELWDKAFLAQRLAAEPTDKMAKYQNVFAAGNGIAWNVADTVNAKRGITLGNLQEYLKGIEMENDM
jgi:hypothetical protein